MALSYVGSSSQSVGPLATATTHSLSLTGGSNSAPSPGDIVVVIYAICTASTRDPSITVTGNNNGSYTNVTGSPLRQNATSTSDADIGVLYKIQGSTVDTSLTLSSTGNGADLGAVVTHVWRGVDTTTPIDVTPVTATGTGGAVPNPGQITPTTTDAVILAAAAGAFGFTAPSAFTSSDLSNLRSQASSTAFYANAAIGSYAWSSGAFDPAAWGGGGTEASGSWAAITLALRPAPPTGSDGDLNVTLADATLSSAVTVPIVATLTATLEAATLDAEGSVVISGDLAETLGAAALASTVQVGDGVIGAVGEAALALDDATLDSTVELDVIGEVATTLDAATLAAFATVGSTGPFAIRPTLHFT